MSANMNQQRSHIELVTGQLKYRYNALLLLIHVAFIVMFTLIGAYWMAIVNVFSVLFYFILHFLKTITLTRYLKLVFSEIILHMIVATLLLGWKFGFQYYTFGVIPALYYGNYLASKRENRTYNPMTISVFVLIVFILLRITTLFVPHIQYELSTISVHYLSVINLIAVGVFIIVFMGYFKKVANENERIIKEIATTDQLTNLKNRHYAMDYLEENFKRAYNNSDSIVLAIVDIDDFKRINDTYGHIAGDQGLVYFAKILKQYCNQDTLVARWGGEEFLLCSKGENSKAFLVNSLEKVRLRLEEEAFIYLKENIKIRFTAGIAEIGTFDHIDQLINLADTNLYKGKASGKNRIVL